MNDYDTICNYITDINTALSASVHSQSGKDGNSTTITRDGFISANVRLARLAIWVSGLAESHRAYQKPAAARTTIRDRRKELGLSQEELASLAELSRNYIGILERDKDARENISLKAARAIAAALNSDIDSLFPEEV